VPGKEKHKGDLESEMPKYMTGFLPVKGKLRNPTQLLKSGYRQF